MDRPLVSIITPSYNSEEYIAETIRSVQTQTYPYWELIIVDDCSSDGTVAIAQEFSLRDQRLRITVLPENKGAAFCRNLATQQAEGDYIAFLDSDDLWHPQKLEKQLDFMLKHTCDVCFSSYLHIDEMGHEMGRRIIARRELTYEKQLRNNYIGNLTGIYHSKNLGKIEAPNLRKRQDWAVWLEAIKRSDKPAQGIQEDLAYYRVRTSSLSRSKFNLIRFNFQFYHGYLKYNFLKSLYFMANFFLEYFFVRPRFIAHYKVDKR